MADADVVEASPLGIPHRKTAASKSVPPEIPISQGLSTHYGWGQLWETSCGLIRDGARGAV